MRKGRPTGDSCKVCATYEPQLRDDLSMVLSRPCTVITEPDSHLNDALRGSSILVAEGLQVKVRYRIPWVGSWLGKEESRLIMSMIWNISMITMFSASTCSVFLTNFSYQLYASLSSSASCALLFLHRSPLGSPSLTTVLLIFP